MNSLGQMASMFGRLASGGYKQNLAPTLHMIGDAVKAEVENEIGEYQSGVGPYPDTAQLADSTLETKRTKNLGKSGDPDTPLWATGAFHDDIQYQPNMGDLSVEIGTNQKEAVFTELGTGMQPPRPVFGPSVLRAVPALLPQISAAAGLGIMGGAWKGLSVEGVTFSRSGSTGNILP